jgi:hypothetical protein
MAHLDLIPVRITQNVSRPNWEFWAKLYWVFALSMDIKVGSYYFYSSNIEGQFDAPSKGLLDP